MITLDPLNAFIDTVKKWGLEFYAKFYGDYRAEVTRNDDPEFRGRVQLRCPAVGNRIALDRWVEPDFALVARDRGVFMPPEVGDQVWVRYWIGNPSKPLVYRGGWIAQQDTPAEFRTSPPVKRGIVTKAGHVMMWNDKSGEEAIRLIWHKPDPSAPADRTKGKFSFVGFEADGSIILSNQNGSTVSLDATKKQVVVVSENGNTIVLDDQGVKIVDKNGNVISTGAAGMQLIAQKGLTVVAPGVALSAGGVYLGKGADSPAGGSPVTKGNELMLYLGQLIALLQSHVHPLAGPTATGPTPVVFPAPPQSILSQKAKVG